MKWAHSVITSFFHAEVGRCDAERLLSHNTEVKDELQFCLLDHNQTSTEEVSNDRWLLILSYLAKLLTKLMTWKSVVFFCVYWCTYLHIHGFDILALLLLSYDSLFYFFFMVGIFILRYCSTATEKHCQIWKYSYLCTSYPRASRNWCACFTFSKSLRDGWVHSLRHRKLWLASFKWQQIGAVRVI